MFPWSNFLRPNKTQTKQSRVARIIGAAPMGQPVWTPRRFDKLTEEGYQRNPIVYRSVSLISRGAASVKWSLNQAGHTLDKHPLTRLIHHPNPQQALPRFIEALTGYLLLSGNAYIEAVGALETGKPLELHLLRPDRIKIIPGHNGLPRAYEYSVSGHSRRIPALGDGTPSPILHMKTFHPLNDWYGMSPIEAAASAIDQHNQVSSHNLALLQNGARPTGAFEYTQGTMTEDQRETLRDEIERHCKRITKTGSPLVLEGGLTWHELGLSPKDLDFVEGKYLSAREIAQAYGVPSMLVGIPGDATFANYREARYHLWEDTILPLLEMLKSDFNHWLQPYFGEEGSNLELTYDTESISALTPKREAAWTKVAKTDFLTVNEKRRSVGYPTLPGFDSLPNEMDPHTQ